MSENLPAARATEHPSIPAQSLGSGGQHPVVRALQQDIILAAGAVRTMPDRGSLLQADVSVAASTVVVCAATTPADALQVAANWCREAAGARLHSINYAEVVGHREDVTETRVTLTVSFRDEMGEYTGDTHRAGPVPHVLFTTKAEADPTTTS